VQFELKLEQSASFLSRHVPVLDPRNKCTHHEAIVNPRTADSRCDYRAVVVKRQAVFWQERLTALKAGAIATGGR
jgi:hypothetical protein